MATPTNTCEDCHFFELDYSEDTEASTGICRRYPPNAIAADVSSFWPTVDIDDWCGEYQVSGGPA